MKLPNFDDNPELNALRNAMGANLRDYTPPAPSEVLTTEEIERLAGEGIEIPLDEVRVLNDGTHIYKGRRVIVYIRDVAEYGGRTSMPKYHLAMCSTLSMMMEAGRFKTRYVVATRDDGLFSIKRIRGDTAIKSDEKLKICQQCLDELNYKSFSMRQSAQRRLEAVQGFSIKAFFDEFGKSCVWAMPKFDAINAPTNVYSPHFYRIAKALKEKRGYRCERTNCGIDLAGPGNRKFLHAHHLNADKSDNHPTNIKLLCIRCHASEFQHSHVRDNPDYGIFCRKFPNSEATPRSQKP
ncbi:HNH endonuclease signature motif containing protein [Bradyrhizobium sp. CSS354]|uniref:HNH endonuclease signature motif containing protein n=1 Tax=Bradyrhizobium sp. CSS354 TaxID=2699172 RepID=UPI0023B1129B|nr:HNH endonuclease signature motif containing protein [Bradyrhizobium sp. CSS354]MDE5464636.1 HNH endonuclease [Bradyrhizobium sp. CSS354]